MIALWMHEPSSKKLGYFRSYRDIGEFLSQNGETGKYFAIPKNIKSLAGMKEIEVINHGYSKEDDEMFIEITMEGSNY